MDRETTVAENVQVGHVVPVKVLVGTWGALMVLTFITVAVTWLDLGSLNLLLAVGIATAKATLVALYFMHLRWDSGLNRVVFLAAILFVAIFISITLMDTLTYAPDRDLDYAPDVNR